MIDAHRLVKRYGSTMAVNDLSFSIQPGMVTGFLGPNGAGKTTTMRLILGLDAPPRLIRAVGISSRMCWKAHRLNGGSCQFFSVTRHSFGNGGAPAIKGSPLGIPTP
jgi:ABC-type cobalamin/Fe3+-siderophores transport system ATPase subunit